MATCYPTYGLSPPQRVVQVPVQKDYSRPLHVDCSIEYELPNAAKPPQGVKNEPLLMIHPFYFRKMESQRRSPFINNLPPPRPATAIKRRIPRGQQIPQQVPQQASQYPVQYAAGAEGYLWDNISSIVPMSSAAQAAYTRKPTTTSMPVVSACGQTFISSTGSDSGHWTDPDRSPDQQPENKLMYSHPGKYRQCLKTHRLHPYVGSAISLGPTFPQIHQVCYNV